MKNLDLRTVRDQVKVGKWCEGLGESPQKADYALAKAIIPALLVEIDRLSQGYPWHDDPPKNNGIFFYNGGIPNGQCSVFTGVVSIYKNPHNAMERLASVYFQPYRGEDGEIHEGDLVVAPLAQWTGQWAGPDYGLNCAYCQPSNQA